MALPGMAGTRRAYETCAGCGHARIRHAIHGAGACTTVRWVVPPTLRGAPPVAETCPCVMFTTTSNGD